MARAKKQEVVEEVHAPDFGLAVRIYRQDIKPATSKAAEFNQEKSEAYKALKQRAHIQPAAAKQAFLLDTMEEAKRDDWLRSFNGILKELNIFMPTDLVDVVEGKGTAGESVVPTGGTRARPKLVTVPSGPEADDLLESAAAEVTAEKSVADESNDFLAKARGHLSGQGDDEQEQAAE